MNGLGVSAANFLNGDDVELGNDLGNNRHDRRITCLLLSQRLDIEGRDANRFLRLLASGLQTDRLNARVARRRRIVVLARAYQAWTNRSVQSRSITRTTAIPLNESPGPMNSARGTPDLRGFETLADACSGFSPTTGLLAERTDPPGPNPEYAVGTTHNRPRLQSSAEHLPPVSNLGPPVFHGSHYQPRPPWIQSERLPTYENGSVSRKSVLAIHPHCDAHSAMQPTTEFAIIPDRKSIASVEREIRFFPSENASPDVLTRSQIETWNSDGYLGPLDVYDQESILETRHYFDGLLASTLAEGKDSYSISSAHLKHQRVWDILTNPRIVAYVRDILGQDVVGWGSHFFCKMPGDGKRVDWHQDCSYWPLTPTKALTVWLAIDDADKENGCMEIYSGSHVHGLIDFDTSDAESGNVLDQSVKHPERYGQHRFDPSASGPDFDP